ncbi:MAG: biliverdin-producing heme oxygenase [Desulfomonilaceae bacterium]|jgi:heme oxygenase
MAKEFMQRLREAIMPLHDEAEKSGPLSAIEQKTITLERYKKILERLYGFISVAEDLIIHEIQPSGLDFGPRTRTNHLENDLIFLGHTRDSLTEIPLCDDISAIRTIHGALGLAYLSEGSRLGGLVLSKDLVDCFGFVDFQGYAYFASNGMDVPSLWLSFKDFMENYVESQGGGSEIILAARNGFASLNEWLAGP